MHFWQYRNYTNVQETAKFNSTNCAKLFFNIDLLLKVIYHPLYGMNNYVLGVIGYHVTLSGGSHDRQSPHIWSD